MIKHIVILLLFLFNNLSLMGQFKDERTGILLSKEYKERNLYTSLDFILSGQSIGFHSDKFNELVTSKSLKIDIGWEVGIKFSYNRIAIDGNYYISKGNFPGIDSFAVSGYGGFVSYKLPYLQTRLFNPYLGVGYQWSNISGSISSVKSLLDTSQPIWKIGIAPIVIKDSNSGNVMYSIVLEYRQSVDTKNQYSYNQFIIGIGYNFFHKKHKIKTILL